MFSNLKLFLIENWYPKGRTDKDLADKLGVGRSTMCQWISGELEPTTEKKILIAKALMVDSRLLWPEVKKGAD